MTYHALYGLSHFTNGQFESQTDSLAILILLLHRFQHGTSLLLVHVLLGTEFVGDLAVFVNNTEADDLVAIFYQFFDKPLEREL